MKPNHKRLLGKMLAPVALSGIIWSLNAQTPVQAQNTDLAAPPKIDQSAPDHNRDAPPEDGERGPRGRHSRDGDKPRPQGAGPRDHRGPGRDGDDEAAGPPRPGRRDDEREQRYGGPGPERGRGGPRDHADDDDFGPPRGGPGDDERGPARGGPRDDGPDGDFGPPPPALRDSGPGEERGPRRRGPRGEGRRGPDGRGPEAGGPHGERGPSDGGPRGRRPGGRGNAIDEAGHLIGDVDIFQNLSGDAYNVSGQAREYYRRALTAQQSGDRANAARYGRVSSELAHAAVRLAETQTGKRVPELRGDGLRGERPQPDAAREKEHASHVLNDAYRALGETSGKWNATARRLYTQARNEFNAAQYEQARGHAAAAMHLAEAGRDSA